MSAAGPMRMIPEEADVSPEDAAPQDAVLAAIHDLARVTAELLTPPDFSVVTDIPPQSKYSPLIHSTLCRLRMLGMSNASAARAAGIAPTTLTRWLKQFPKLACDLDRAEQASNGYVMVLLRRIMESDGPTAFRAIRFFLETHSPEFKRRQVLEVQPSDGDEVVRKIGSDLYGLGEDADGDADGRAGGDETEAADDAVIDFEDI